MSKPAAVKLASPPTISFSPASSSSASSASSSASSTSSTTPSNLYTGKTMSNKCIHNRKLGSCVRCNRQYRSSTPNPVAQGIFCKHGWNKHNKNTIDESGLLPCRDPLCVARRTYTPRGTGTLRVRGGIVKRTYTPPRVTGTPRVRGGIVKQSSAESQGSSSSARLLSPVKPVELFPKHEIVEIVEIADIDRPFEEIDLENPFGIDPVFFEMEGGGGKKYRKLRSIKKSKRSSRKYRKSSRKYRKSSRKYRKSSRKYRKSSRK